MIGLLVAGGLLLCGLLAVWGMVEALAHGTQRLKLGPPLAARDRDPHRCSTPRPYRGGDAHPARADRDTNGSGHPDAPSDPSADARAAPARAADADRDPGATLAHGGYRPAAARSPDRADPGHGPRDDLGAVYVDPKTNKLVLSEDIVNLDVAQITRGLLEARGATVFLTRETKEAFTTPWPADANGDGIEHGQADDLQWRIDEMNSFGPRSSSASTRTAIATPPSARASRHWAASPTIASTPSKACIWASWPSTTWKPNWRLLTTR